MNWMILPLKRYADFSGRSRRTEYWMFTLLYVLVIAVCFGLFAIDMSMQSDSVDPEPGVLGIAAIGIGVIWALGTIIPGIAVAVRRFHDQDKSGWMYLLSFIPYIGSFILLVFMCIEGTRGPNQYGDDPKGESTADIFS